ncbi:MAG: hypothetical protein KKB50_09140 [Planctomycetes bacterium]|nr:hypothetical protein [Planctomycetota bacterium]
MQKRSSGPDLPLGGVVLEGDLRVVQEGEQMIAGATQTLAQPPGVGVVHVRGDQRVQPPAQPQDPTLVFQM